MRRGYVKLLLALVYASLLAGGAIAQTTGNCVLSVPGPGLIPLSNSYLSTVENLFGFEPEEVDNEGNVVEAGTTGCRLSAANLSVANVLSRLDIDDDDVADGAPDSDGDGLPDNWELGGVETSSVMEDRVVFFSAPTAIVPGTPPTPIFTRRAVATDALQADTDMDGLTDFIEVFGLMFIDDNRNGVLDHPSEWMDLNLDGLPSPGEYPVDGSNEIIDVEGFLLLHDFDGFVFTDPTNPDTDGDGVLDGADRDPLVNPRAFGIADRIIVRYQALDNPDIDQDGLGNGMDMGNDLLPSEAPDLLTHQVIDNPANLRELLDLFRDDLLDEGIVPESAIEDLLGADWDGNGLWRTTDVRTWTLHIDPDDPDARPPDTFFLLEELGATVPLYAPQDPADLIALYNSVPTYDRYGSRGVGLGWQEVLKPSSTDAFMPDKRIWAILYAWRMPGFDIDGDGFIGVPNLTATAEGTQDGFAMLALHRNTPGGDLALSDEVLLLSTNADLDQPFDDRIPIGAPEPEDPNLNGVVEVDNLRSALASLGCGAMGLTMVATLATCLLLPAWLRRR
jgi:hypothetical protein